MKIAQLISFITFTLFLTQSCSTMDKKQANRPSSKVVYSLMTKDTVGLESVFSKDLRKSLKGEMMLKAFSSVQKERGDMEALEFIETKGNMDIYSIRMKKGKVPLRLQFNANNQLENVWINEVAMKR
jgi:hypothetical protein